MICLVLVLFIKKINAAILRYFKTFVDVFNILYNWVVLKFMEITSQTFFELSSLVVVKFFWYKFFFFFGFSENKIHPRKRQKQTVQIIFLHITSFQLCTSYHFFSITDLFRI
jgi:hypothetical protein